MPAPAWLGPAITGASSIIGGLFGKKSNDSARAFQKEAMQKGIQWKVKDAKAAGLHPLFALGAQTNQPAAITGSALGDGIAAAGSAVGSAISRRGQNARAAELHTASLEESKARTAKDFAQAQLFNSQMKREEQRANIQQDRILLSSRSSNNGRNNRNLRFANVDITRNPAFSDAQDMEDRYGDIVGGTISGTSNLLADTYLLNKKWGAIAYKNAKKAYKKRHKPSYYKKRYKMRSGYRNNYR